MGRMISSPSFVPNPWSVTDFQDSAFVGFPGVTCWFSGGSARDSTEGKRPFGEERQGDQLADFRPETLEERGK